MEVTTKDWECATCWKQGRMGVCKPVAVGYGTTNGGCANHETSVERVSREVRELGVDMVGALAMEKVGEEPPPKPKPKPKREFNREAFTTGVYRFLVVVLLFVIALGVWLGPYSIINTIR